MQYLEITCALSMLLPCFRSVYFLKTNISQGTVMTHLICGGICSDCSVANIQWVIECAGERIFTIGQYFVTIYTRVWWLVF